MDNQTIAAIATPIGSGGIGVVRISGPDAIPIGQRLFSLRKVSPPSESDHPSKDLGSHRLRLGFVFDPHSGDVIDEVLMAMMPAPRSYTREDVVEIQSHSGFIVLSRILNAVLACGARMAEPGEFTKRAFLNGRIDLSQAEAIADMIAAKSEAGQQLAATHLTGGLKSAVNGFMDALTEVQVELEAGIEFPDDVEHVYDGERIAQIVTDCVIEPAEALLRQYDEGHVYRDGIRLDIIGRPNVGKSSLLNRLINKDKAIVTSLPGTTRDLVEDQITISGIPVLVTDTAGLHRTEDPVEVIGMRKTRENLELSDLVLWVVDGEQGITDDDHTIYEQMNHRNLLLVINKTDLMADQSDLKFPQEVASLDRVLISAKFGDGIELLRKAIRDKCLTEVVIDPGRSLVPNLRQKKALETALASLRQMVEGIHNQQPDELIADDLVASKNALGVITGDRIDDDILDEIFGKFCIGK